MSSGPEEVPHHKFKEGELLEFIYDDGSRNPKFRRVGDGETGYCNIKRLKLAPILATAEQVTYTVESNKDNTTVFVRKQLSLDQIKRILDIVGE